VWPRGHWFRNAHARLVRGSQHDFLKDSSEQAALIALNAPLAHGILTWIPTDPGSGSPHCGAVLSS
jgi:hypothetical protein